MSNVPEARELIKEIIDVLRRSEDPVSRAAAHDLENWVMPLLYRKRWKNAPNAPATSAPITPELSDKLRRYVYENPELPFQKIGERFNVCSGRVSEALACE